MPDETTTSFLLDRAPPAEPLPERFQAHIVHESRLGELIALHLKSIALTILTLGIYHFWARTNVRRLLWRRTRFLDDPFEYLGRPIELLKGFSIVALVYMAPVLLLNSILIPRLAAEAEPESDLAIALLQVGLGIAIVYLIFVGGYAARRYRLSRTSWRGIRGAQTGSAWLYGLKGLGYAALSVVTLGWFYPWQTMRLAEARVVNAWFGSQRCEFFGKGRDLLLSFALFWLAGALLFGWALWMIATTPPAGQLDTTAAATGWAAFPLLVVTVAIPTAWLAYNAHATRAIAQGTRLGSIRFEYSYTTWQYIRYVLGNCLIALLTLGTGWIYLQRRQFGFWRRYLVISGLTSDFARFQQTREAGPRHGEGLAEVFDIGF